MVEDLVVPKAEKKKKRKQLEIEEPDDDAVVKPKKHKKSKENPADAELGTTVVAENAVAEGKKKKKKKPIPEEVEAAEAPEETARKEKRAKKEKKAQAAEKAADVKEEGADPSASESKGFCVFVGGIPWAVDDDKLKEDFEECGEVTDVHLLRDKVTGQSRGTAFITFTDEVSVKNALKYDGDDYGGRTLKVTRADSKADKGLKKGDAGKGGGKAPPKHEIFIKKLSSEVDEATLRSDFSQFGTIERLNFPFGQDGKCKGFAWIQFKSEAAVEKALNFNGTDYNGKQITVERSGQHVANPNLAPGKGGGRAKDSDTGKAVPGGFEIFIKNFAYETTEEDIRKDFGECGEIVRLKMPMIEGKSMGFCWITYRTKEAMDAAIAYDGDTYGSRRLKVEKAGLHAKGASKHSGRGK